MYNLHFILCNESQWKICLCAAKRDLKSQLIKTLMFIFPPCKMKTGYSRLGVVQRFCNVKWVSEWSRSVMSDSLRPLNCSLPGSSIRGIFQARILEWVAISFSRGSSLPRDWTRVFCILDRHFTVWATREVCNVKSVPKSSSFFVSPPIAYVPFCAVSSYLQWMTFHPVPSYSHCK